MKAFDCACRYPLVPNYAVFTSRECFAIMKLTQGLANAAAGRLYRIDPASLSGVVPYPLAGGYILVDSPRDAGLTPIPSDHENDVMNAGYVVQWWAFAALTLAGFGWAARREARGPDEFDLAELHADHPDAPVSPGL